MWDKKEQDRLNSLRERLYSRGEEPKQTERDTLSDITQEVKTSWDIPQERKEENVVQSASSVPPPPPPMPKTQSKRYSYRIKILLTAIFFFVMAAALSSLFILFGSNSISGENISVTMTGPFTVGGGEEISIQIGITNQNSVPIESATLIIDYPSGTQAVGEGAEELFNERIPLDVIRSGESVNVPIRARIFGEENQELQINAAVEYRVSGSNATFFKEAEPLRFKVGSSPVSLEIESVERISSGQEAEIVLAVKSNTAVPLRNVLVRAEYPSGFEFTGSSPSPVSSQNIWRIAELAPEEEETVRITGLVSGGKTEGHAVNFSVGVPSERNELAISSVFATASTEFTIEQPFLDVQLSVNNSRDTSVSIDPGRQSSVRVEIENTLDEAIYDAVVEVKLAGNALSDLGVNVAQGFYNSNTQTIVWDSSSISKLAQLDPGDSHTFSFNIDPDLDAVRTPQIDLSVSVRAARVREPNASNAVVGSITRTIKISSNVSIEGSADRESGPVPPEVGESTVYTVSLETTGGSNEVTNAQVTGTLPSYVSWVGVTSGDGQVSYNSSSRSVDWNIGNLGANDTARATFDVSLTPSVSQIGSRPTLLSSPQFRADDRFTGSTIRASGSSISTELDPAEYGEFNGRVVE